jgi:L-fuculose-phosphate aldolase
MTSTLTTSKAELVRQSQQLMEQMSQSTAWSTREKLALTCRILFDAGHDSGLAGQITARAKEADTYYTQQLGLGFDEITASNLLLVDRDLEPLKGEGIPNPANRFHTWVYREHPRVNCIIHTHPFYTATLSMLEEPLVVSHMDNCPLFDDCAFLGNWPGIPVGNEEGVLISGALGTKRTLLLAHHGLLVTGKSVEEALMLAHLIERAARMQLTAMAAGAIQPIDPALAREAHDWISTKKRYQAFFAYYARRALHRHPDCLS